MGETKHAVLMAAAACALAACGPEAASAPEASESNRIVTSGKEEVPLAEVPAEVLEVARAARSGFTPTEAERETRDGRLYFDIGGTLPDGSEIEFDIMEEDGRWRVVETQRDIAFSAAPTAVRQAAESRQAGLTPTRVIESVQEDGLVIYEVYAPEGGDPQGLKIEVKWDGRTAEVLAQEWAH